MKTKYIYKLLIGLCVILSASCKKESANIFNMFDDVTVTFNNSDPRCVTDYKVINEKEEVWIDFTINSAKEDMYSYVFEVSAGTAQATRYTIAITNPSQRRSFSTIIKLPNSAFPAAAIRDGKQSYRICALNEKGVFIGDGYKKVTVDVNPSFMIYANRDIYLPDTVAKSLPSFFSVADATGYNYTSAVANAGKIDFGIYRKPGSNSTVQTPTWVVNLYSPSVATNPLTVYDISGFSPKRTTKFSQPVTGQANAFLTTAISGSSIEILAKARAITFNETTQTTPANGLAAGNAVFFLTPEGKYGMIYINAVTSDLQKRPFINVSIKLQR
ncbi:hypothetical protein EZ449_04000 [Pedobacter frigidisoli]|uniref:DUF4466 domain-containing protein n=1 Tax=Pedobacter frigidisoli TaxID=2530455 RepID=A0A4R0P8B4_9SPHI|nr:hypothetical protein [Pedobacter frigidisoli]TCD12184.1 hypothetical protein EZ449_04000 [Pedobacter frigidisoli]